ncbi:MAG: hypothetical protein M1829_003100 [Trizodia sp. TS-e1964]|nr:MAG: hypothetical protein M1829_003100 [Trizodia sp. TS-e1964]
MTSKNIILTGASRGIGLAVARFLLQSSHKLVVIARSRGPLEELQIQYPSQIVIVTGDLGKQSLGQQAVEVAIKNFSSLDGLVLNHGALAPVERIENSEVDEWKEAFNTNFFSALDFIKASIPHLRKSQGRIVLTSSGAAANAYSAWGAYGSSKAALNHLAFTLSVEEPLITTIAIRPGVVDTEMQREIRQIHYRVMDEKDVEKFNRLEQLLKPEQPGNVICRLVLGGKNALSGKFLRLVLIIRSFQR